jgi:hypothetical protein
MRTLSKALIGMVIALAAVIGLVILGVSLFQDRVRGYVERELNTRVDRYDTRIGTLTIRPLTLTVETERLVVRLKDHPEPPLLDMPRAEVKLAWRALLHGTLAAAIAMDHPTVQLMRPQATPVAQDAKEKAPSLQERQAWQDKAVSFIPVTMSVALQDADVTYIEEEGKPPLHLGHMNLDMGPVRNIQSERGEYPTELRLEAVINEDGHLVAQGHLDVLTKPHPSAKLDLRVENFDLGRLLPVTSRYHIRLYQGRLSADGSIEYAPWTKLIQLRDLKVEHALVNYVYEPQQLKPEKHATRKAAEKATDVARQPETIIQIERITISDSEFGVVHAGVDPPYRAFFNGLSVDAKHFSNRLKEKTAQVTVKGAFMGTGMLEARGMFRPETNTPDFDLSVRLVGVQAKMLNDVLHAHGNIDVADGELSVYSQLKVHQGQIRGYVKPLIRRLNVYDRDQDRGKGVLHTLYEGALDAATAALENDERDEVGTKVEVKGAVPHAQIDTWQAASNLIRNAFVKVVLPSFERPIRPGRKATLGLE